MCSTNRILVIVQRLDAKTAKPGDDEVPQTS